MGNRIADVSSLATAAFFFYNDASSIDHIIYTLYYVVSVAASMGMAVVPSNERLSSRRNLLSFIIAPALFCLQYIYIYLYIYLFKNTLKKSRKKINIFLLHI
uniref:Uncharacterized protein n=1 Tax=Strongyloides papillosus TaxID=174720 RepID=A0A0N5BWB3_STREA